MALLIKRYLALFLGFGVALNLAACGVGLPGTAGPSAPCSVTVSNQAADQFLRRIKSQSSVKGKTVTVTATSEEVSSLLNESVQQVKQNSPGVVIPIENPVVCFKNGQMSIFGTISPDGTHSVNALLTVAAAVSKGKAAFHVEKVEVGPITAPQTLGDAVSGLINDALNQSLDQIHLTEILIQNDQMTLKGTF
jgi:hypothetical protein